MVQFKRFFLILSLVFVCAEAATVIPFKAFCYKHEEDCERAGRVLRSRSSNPFYAYDFSCRREQNKLEQRTRVNCSSGEWKVLFQLRSKLSEAGIGQVLAKKPFLLRSACYRYEADAKATVELLERGAWGEITSVNSRYKIQASYRSQTKQEHLKYENQECHDTRFVVEYFLTKK